ncbi:MAG: hypothetical protein M0018_01990 [Nitrospiraceae bacterium]|nr:hypothetical protein [Nitrospiraceae bacterium]
MDNGKEKGTAKKLACMPFAMAAILVVLAIQFTPAQAWARSATSQISVTAYVMPAAYVRTVYQANSVQVTAADISRGYVEAPAATVVKLGSERGGMVSFGGLSGPFTGFQVTGQGGPAISPDGMYISGGGSRMAGVTLGYRFYLNTQTARPGNYSWPLPVEVSLE